MKIDLKPNETVIRAGDSKYLNGGGSPVRGKLIMTNQRLYFQSSDDVSENHKLELEPKEIKDVLFFRSGFMQSNGLKLVTKEGKELRFVIRKRNSWCEMICKMC